MKEHHCIARLFIVAALSFATSVAYADDTAVKTSTLAETTKEFLSDPARTGSLVGSIIAGSAIANPLAPLLGSVAGFMIGKSSAFSKEDRHGLYRHSNNNRSIIPMAGVDIATVSGLSGDSTVSVQGITIDGLTSQIEQDEDPVSAPVVINQATTQSAKEQTLLLETQRDASSGVTIVSESHDSFEPALSETAVSKAGARFIDSGLTLVPVPAPVLAPAMPKSISEHKATLPDFLPAEVAPDLEQQIQMLSSLQKKLATSCDNSGAGKSVSVNCYYHSR